MALGLTPLQIIQKETHPQLVIANEWERIELKYIATVQNGFAFSSKLFNQTEGLPLIRIRDIFSAETQNLYSGEFKEEFIVEKGDILIGMDGDFKVSKWPGKKGLLNQRVCRIHFNSKFYEKEFLFLCIQPYLNAIHSETSAVTVKHLSSRTINNIPFPLPPLPIQRAIVSKIESLFSSLDSGIADLKKAQEQLKIYRQAVLKKAFEGEYPIKKIIDIADVRTGATPKRGNGKFWENGTVPWVTSTVVNKPFVNEHSELITEQAIKETNCKLIPKGSLLMAMYGEGKTRGKCSELLIDAATNQALAAITIKEEYGYSKKYLKQFLLKNYEEIRLLSSRGVQPNLNLTIVKNTELPFPKENIQKRIVKEIESRLSVCDKVEKDINDSLEKAQALRQSILKKAFEGRLLTGAEIELCKQEADYEPASVLLERIKKEK